MVGRENVVEKGEKEAAGIQCMCVRIELVVGMETGRRRTDDDDDDDVGGIVSRGNRHWNVNEI